MSKNLIIYNRYYDSTPHRTEKMTNFALEFV